MKAVWPSVLNQSNTLARYWEAVGCFQKAIRSLEQELSSTSVYQHSVAVLHEMSGQCLAEIGEVFQAVRSSELAIMSDKTYSVGYQTLARSQVRLYARKSFLSFNIYKAKSVPIHMIPSLLYVGCWWLSESTIKTYDCRECSTFYLISSFLLPYVPDFRVYQPNIKTFIVGEAFI